MPFDPTQPFELIPSGGVATLPAAPASGFDPTKPFEIVTTPAAVGADARTGPARPTNQPPLTPSAASGLSDPFVNRVKAWEGFQPKAYGDYRQTSIGYGTRAKAPGETITPEAADARLREELGLAARNVDGAIQKAKANLTPAQREALVSFDFNTGSAAQVIGETGGDWTRIAAKLPEYTKAGGQENPGLVNRRRDELAWADGKPAASGFDPSKPFTVEPPRFEAQKVEKPPAQITGARYVVQPDGTGKYTDVQTDFQKDQKPFASFGGQMYFDPRRYGQGVEQARKAGLLGDADYTKLAAQAPAVEAAAKAHDDLVKQAGSNPELKAVMQGAGRGGVSLGLASETAEATGELGPWISFPATAGAAVAGAAGYDNAMKTFAPVDAHIRALQAAAQLHPMYSEAGDLAAFAVPLPSSIGKLAEAGRIVQETKGAPAAVRYLAAQVGKGAAIGAATDAAFQVIGKATGLQQGSYDPKSTAFSGLLGGLLAGHGIRFRGLSTGDVADVVQRGLTGNLTTRADADIFEKAMAQMNSLRGTGASGMPEFQGTQVESLNGPATRLETVRGVEPVKLDAGDAGPASPEATPGQVRQPDSAGEFEALVDQNRRPVMRATLYRDLGYPLATLDAMSDQEMSAALSARAPYTRPPAPVTAPPAAGNDPDWSVPPTTAAAATPARPPEDIEAEAQYRREMEAAMRGANEEHGIELGAALQELGGLPEEGSPYHGEFAGELRDLAEQRLGTRKMSGNKNFAQGLFRPGARSLDQIAEGLREMGADIEGPDDVIQATRTWLSKAGPLYLPARDVSAVALADQPRERNEIRAAVAPPFDPSRPFEVLPASGLASAPSAGQTVVRDEPRTQAPVPGSSQTAEDGRAMAEGPGLRAAASVPEPEGRPEGNPAAPPDWHAAVSVQVEKLRQTRPKARIVADELPEPISTQRGTGRVRYNHDALAAHAAELHAEGYDGHAWLEAALDEEDAHRRDVLAAAKLGYDDDAFDARVWTAAPPEVQQAVQHIYHVADNDADRGAEVMRMLDQIIRGKPLTESILAPLASAKAVEAINAWDKPDFLMQHAIEMHMVDNQEDPEADAPEREGEVHASTLHELRAQPPEYTGLESADDKGNPYAPVPLTGLADIKIIQMPELVTLAKGLMGELPTLKKLPKARGHFEPLGNGRIKLDPRIFAHPESAAKTLAHEIGHLIDFLPQKLLQRGNLWGRLHSLRGWMKERWTTQGPTNTELREELLALSMHWKPWDPVNDPKSYVDYRRSGIELYADFISVLFNSPATAKQMAPRFYREFFAGLDSKPEVKDAFFQMQTWLNRPHMRVLQDRAAEMHRWFGQAEEIFERKMKERELRYRGYRGMLDRLKQGFFDAYAPIRGRAKGTPAEHAVKFFFDAHPLAENLNYRLLENLHRTVVQPLERAGHSLDDLGEYLFLNRVLNERYEVSRQIAGESQIETGGRSVIANPGGQVPATARLGLLRMRLEKGPRGMDQMERAAQKFHDTVFRIMQEAHHAGLLTDDQMKLIAANRDSYATFTPLEYVDTFVPGGIRQQAGTFKEVANPYVSTVLKMITMQRAIELQRAKQMTVGTLVAHFPDEIQPAETRNQPGGGKQPVPPKVKGQRQLMLRDAGKPAWYNVPAEIAEMFERGDVPLLRSVAELMGTPFRKVFYPLFITFNPVFQLIRHPVREARRSFRNAPEGLFNNLMRGVRPELRAFVKGGEISPLIAEMLEQMVITPPELDFISSLQRTDAFGQILRNFSLLPESERPAWQDAKLLQPALKLFRWIEQTGHTNMLMPRVATYKAMTGELGWPREDAAFYVRNFIGVPNHMKKGKYAWLASPIFPFINVWSKGWAADLELATKGYKRSDGPDKPGKSPASWWFRWASTSGMWTILKVAAGLGLMGAGIKRLMDGISTHDKLNYDVIPIGTAPGKDFGTKTVFMKIPQDQSDRLLSGLVFMLLTRGGEALQGKGLNTQHALSDLFSVGTSDMPGVNPAVSVARGWMQYLDGQNPIDSFRNRPVLTNDEFLAGGWPGMRHMLGWTYGQAGLQTFVSYNPQADSTLETVLGSTPVLNGVVNVSDYGYREQQEDAQHKIDAKSAELRLSLDPAVQQLLHERGHLDALRKAVRTPAQQMRLQSLNGWYARVYRPAEQAALETGDKGPLSGLKSASQPYESGE